MSINDLKVASNNKFKKISKQIKELKHENSSNAKHFINLKNQLTGLYELI